MLWNTVLRHGHLMIGLSPLGGKIRTKPFTKTWWWVFEIIVKDSMSTILCEIVLLQPHWRAFQYELLSPCFVTASRHEWTCVHWIIVIVLIKLSKHPGQKLIGRHPLFLFQRELTVLPIMAIYSGPDPVRLSAWCSHLWHSPTPLHGILVQCLGHRGKLNQRSNWVAESGQRLNVVKKVQRYKRYKRWSWREANKQFPVSKKSAMDITHRTDQSQCPLAVMLCRVL